MIITIFDVSEFFLSKSEMTHKKLQKLCYYAQAHYIAKFNKPLFANAFEAWLHGPVSPDLYLKFHEYGSYKIPQQSTFPVILSPDIPFLEEIWRKYGNLCDFELEKLAKSEMPWLKARRYFPDSFAYCRNPIYWEDMQTTYKETI